MPAASGKPRLLLVDDEPDLLDFLERALRRRYEVSRCQSARQALDCLRDGEFDVLITDQRMPNQTGLELLEELGDERPGMVRVLISGYADVKDLLRASAHCRIHNYIVKPVDSRRLLAAVDEAFEVRDGRREFDLDRV